MCQVRTEGGRWRERLLAFSIASGEGVSAVLCQRCLDRSPAQSRVTTDLMDMVVCDGCAELALQPRGGCGVRRGMDPQQAIRQFDYLNKIISSVLTELPGGSAFVHFVDSIKSDARFSEIERRLAELERPRQISLLITIALERNAVPETGLRDLEGCMALMAEISARSVQAQERDGDLDQQECIEFVRKRFGPIDLRKRLRRIIYELERTGLIFKDSSANAPEGWVRIAPTRQFFCRTDALFQNWNPEKDALSIVKRMDLDDQERCSVAELEARLVWGPRRMNPALAYMELHGWVRNEFPQITQKYITDHVWLSSEAYFFLEKNS